MFGVWVGPPLGSARQPADTSSAKSSPSDWHRFHSGGAMGTYSQNAGASATSVFISKDSGHEIVVLAWTDVVANSSPTASGQASTSWNAKKIAEAWVGEGDALVTKMGGPFSFVLWDSRKQIIFGARDPLGIRPLMLFQHGSTVGLLASANVAWRIPGFKPRLNLEWTGPFLHATIGVGTMTALLGIEHVPPGYSVSIEKGNVTLAPFYAWGTSSSWANRRSEQDLQKYRTSLETAIERAIPQVGSIAVESSGGIDSAAILAVSHVSGRAARHRVHALTYEVFAEERARVASVNSCFPGLIEKSWPGESLYSGDVVAAQEQAWDAIGYPAEHPNSAAHSLFYEYAQSQRITTLLSGLGGDEGVSSLAFHQATELWRRGRLWSASEAADRRGAVSRLRYILRRLLLGDSSGRASLDHAQMMLSLSLMSDRALSGMKVRESLLTAWKVGSDATTVNDYAVARLTSRQLWARVIESSLIAAHYGVDYRYPLLDLDLVRVYLETPSIWKRKGSTGRYLHRSAIEDWLPPEIVWNTPKAAGEIVSRPPHQIDVEGEVPYINRLVSQLPDSLREIVDVEKLRALGAHTDERERFYARQILSRIDELSRWIRAYTVT